MMLVNVKLDINGSKRITFEDYEIHCSLAILAFLYYGEFVKTSISRLLKQATLLCFLQDC